MKSVNRKCLKWQEAHELAVYKGQARSWTWDFGGVKYLNLGPPELNIQRV